MLLSFAKKHMVALTVLAVSLIVVLWFGASILLDLLYFNDPRHKDEALKPWMTPRYVALSYDLPRPLIEDIFALTDADQGRVKLRDIAERRDMTLDELTALVRAAAAEHRATKR